MEVHFILKLYREFQTISKYKLFYFRHLSNYIKDLTQKQCDSVERDNENLIGINTCQNINIP